MSTQRSSGQIVSGVTVTVVGGVILAALLAAFGLSPVFGNSASDEPDDGYFLEPNDSPDELVDEPDKPHEEDADITNEEEPVDDLNKNGSEVVLVDLTLPETWIVDLDDSDGDLSSTSDIWFAADTATDRRIIAQNGASLGLADYNTGGIDDCRGLDLDNSEIPIDWLDDGVLCVTTSEGALAALLAADVPRVADGGSIAIDQTGTVDLETGQVGVGSASADAWFRAETATNRYWEPVNQAQFRFGDCNLALAEGGFSSGRIEIGELAQGAVLCGWTRNYELVELSVADPAGPSPGQLVLDWFLWPTLIATYEIAT